MLLILQIAIGSGLLVLCALVHVGVVVASVPVLKNLAKRHDGHPVRQSSRVLSATVMALLLAHTIQIWIWSVFLIWIGQFEDLPTSVYFTLVTYTTLGYGDIVLDPYARIVAAFASVTGLITFGITTAVIVSILSRLLPEFFRDIDRH